jgi:hypothetical protein
MFCKIILRSILSGLVFTTILALAPAPGEAAGPKPLRGPGAIPGISHLTPALGKVAESKPRRIQGTVTAINLNLGTLTLVTRNGVAVTVSVGPQTRVERNGVKAALAAFRKNDFGQALVDPRTALAIKVEATGRHRRGTKDAARGIPPFDFSDDYYQRNGIDPNRILARVDGTAPISVPDETTDPTRRGIRVLQTTGGFEASGNLLYYNIFGMLKADAFTNDPAGRRARTLADRYRAFIFPKQSGDPLSPGLPNRRQDNVFDTRNGYFDNNPLGLWRLVFVSYTDKAFNTEQGQAVVASLKTKNGCDLDGTPILKSASDIDNLARQGFVLLRMRASDGSQGFPWVI